MPVDGAGRVLSHVKWARLGSMDVWNEPSARDESLRSGVRTCERDNALAPPSGSMSNHLIRLAPVLVLLVAAGCSQLDDPSPGHPPQQAGGKADGTDVYDPNQGPPSCDGPPNFPTTGRVYFDGAIDYAYTRTCDAWGSCTPWKFDIHQGGILSYYDKSYLQPDHVASVAMIDLSSCGNWVRTYGEVLDDNGDYGPFEMEWGNKYCDASSGRRSVSMHLGATCLLVADEEPSVTYGFQVRHFIRVDLQQ